MRGWLLTHKQRYASMQISTVHDAHRYACVNTCRYIQPDIEAVITALQSEIKAVITAGSAQGV